MLREGAGKRQRKRGEMNYGVVNGRIAHALALVGDRWSLAILGELFIGLRRFEEIRRRLGISRATLTRRLDALIRDGVVVRKLYSSSRYQYGLSDKGEALCPFMLLAWRWEQVWADAETRGATPERLFHADCNQPLLPVASCAHCQQSIMSGDLVLSEAVLQSPIFHSDIRPTGQTRRMGVSRAAGDEDIHLQSVAELIGDRWTLLIMMTVFFGTGRHEGFTQQLGISSNSLASRLNRLVEVGILVRYDYQLNPPRSEYAATVKGQALYPVIMVLRQWAEDWGDGPAPAPLVHRQCGNAAVLAVECSHCHHVVRRQDILLAPLEPECATGCG